MCSRGRKNDGLSSFTPRKLDDRPRLGRSAALTMPIRRRWATIVETGGVSAPRDGCRAVFPRNPRFLSGLLFFPRRISASSQPRSAFLSRQLRRDGGPFEDSGDLPPRTARTRRVSRRVNRPCGRTMRCAPLGTSPFSGATGPARRRENAHLGPFRPTLGGPLRSVCFARRVPTARIRPSSRSTNDAEEPAGRKVVPLVTTCSVRPDEHSR